MKVRIKRRTVGARAHPIEWMLWLFLFVGGLSTTTSLGRPSSLDRVLPHGLLVMWSWGLTIGALLALLGIAWQGRIITALTLEQIGLGMLSGTAVIYGSCLIAAWANGAPGALLVTCFVAYYGVAAAFRCSFVFRLQRALVNQKTGDDAAPQMPPAEED